MSANQTPRASSATPKAAADGGVAQVQAKVDQETKQGYAGFVADPTPNANYTVAGVTGNAPTPETVLPDGGDVQGEPSTNQEV